jgi:predicted Fe-S protein YdhL (DUF1289 family)
VGCHRTIDEIADWGMMSDERKRSVWQQIRLRRAELDPALPTAPPPDERAPQAPGSSSTQSPDPSSLPAVTPAPGSEGR